MHVTPAYPACRNLNTDITWPHRFLQGKIPHGYLFYTLQNKRPHTASLPQNRLRVPIYTNTIITDIRRFEKIPLPPGSSTADSGNWNIDKIRYKS
jgi:hypothetical protein